ncbi:hypothetical protein SAMD00020551_3795 [Mesobacillus selenatarsenatis SF-1]|uniref:Uncharacterized protein n=1 Tax=Mesobacillus selenatarsenatis (strain DSM 18680 / JCM 14380 / FERM P-15431 / SF-1) TaxID=1321606 RepID=A0A0A8X6T1_MESS1|nr:hypothetical protein SAMD00020551_3795 [Mesobacillus selenatarsenatis SF-1]
MANLEFINKKWNLTISRRNIMDRKYLNKCRKEINVTNL